MISEESVDTFVAVHNAMLQVLKVRKCLSSLPSFIFGPASRCRAPAILLFPVPRCMSEPQLRP